MLAIAAAAEGDMVRNDLLQVDREFNENDYEMLLALDEDNYKHQGATRAEINSLPVSMVQESGLLHDSRIYPTIYDYQYSNTNTTFDSGKGVDVLGDNNRQPCTINKVYRRRKLVQNECVPPFGIEKFKKVVVKCENGSVMKEVTSGFGTVASNGGSSIVDIKDLVAEDNDSRRHKGKGISCQFPSEEANAGSSYLSQREHILKDPAESSTDFDVDAKGWRTTHNHWKQRDNKQEKNEIMKSDCKNETDIKHLVDSAKTSSRMCYQPNENESGINTQTKSSTLRNFEELGIDRQPESSTSINQGKRLISCIEDSVGLSWETSRSKLSKNLTRPRLKRNKNLSAPPSTSNPVLEPNVQFHGNNENLSFRALQMEEDEIFSQQLQQQLYNKELERVDMLARAATAEGDMVRNDLLQVDREFNENDYEMLLALDEDNYKHQGATLAEINSFPVSTVQCVDEWLSRRRSCPVCKTSVDVIG
nr:hypothetical protein [Tanacetum cinerariifolium]